MSNLSLARIMYGSSEFPSTSSMQPRPLQLLSSNLPFEAALTTWMARTLSALFRGRNDRAGRSRS